MAEAEFDIELFSKFKPPRYLCPRCLGITTGEINYPENWEVKISEDLDEYYTCHLCKLTHVLRKNGFNSVHDYLARWGCALEDGDLTERFKAFADVASELRSVKDRSSRGHSALRCLFRLLNEARCFIHFVTWGISWDFIGMLALLSHRVQVRGIVSRCDEGMAKRIRDSIKYGGKGFEVIPLTLREGSKSPHQKLIVIDGLITITGSTNLTVNAWDNLDKGLEHIVVETKPATVMKLHNSLFSPVWAHLHPIEGNTVIVSRMSIMARAWMESVMPKGLGKKNGK